MFETFKILNLPFNTSVRFGCLPRFQVAIRRQRAVFQLLRPLGTKMEELNNDGINLNHLKKGPLVTWLFRIYRGLYYPVMWGLPSYVGIIMELLKIPLQ